MDTIYQPEQLLCDQPRDGMFTRPTGESPAMQRAFDDITENVQAHGRAWRDTRVEEMAWYLAGYPRIDLDNNPDLFGDALQYVGWRFGIQQTGDYLDWIVIRARHLRVERRQMAGAA